MFYNNIVLNDLHTSQTVGIRKCGKSKKEAQIALNEALLKYRNGYIEPAKMTVKNYLTDWLENLIKSNRTANTYFKYKGYWDNNIIKYIGHIPLKDIRPIHIKNSLIYVNGKVLFGPTKTEESNRTLYVSDRILKLLKKHKKIQNENRLKYGSFYEKNIFDSEKRVRFHDLRHTNVTLLL